jgi:hypothetical protein
MGKSLAETNPHLIDPENRKRLIIQAVRSSAALEGVYHLSEERLAQAIDQGREAKVRSIASRKKPVNGR